jgi:hypothetical protein
VTEGGGVFLLPDTAAFLYFDTGPLLLPWDPIPRDPRALSSSLGTGVLLFLAINKHFALSDLCPVRSVENEAAPNFGSENHHRRRSDMLLRGEGFLILRKIGRSGASPQNGTSPA